MQPTLDNFGKSRGGNNQREIEVTALAELLPHGLAVHQARDRDRSCPGRTERASEHGAVVHGHAHSQWRSAPSGVIDRANRGSQCARVVGDQCESVNALGQDSEFPVAAWLAVPAPAAQARARRRLCHRVLETVLDTRLLGSMALAESFDINRHKKSERQAAEILRVLSSDGREPGS